MTDSRFNFWTNWLLIFSAVAAVQGASWAVLGSFDPIGFYDSAMARSFWQVDTLPPDAARTMQFVLGPFGATTAGYFILMFFIVKYAFKRRETWAYWAVTTAFLFWFFLDTVMCLYHQAYFNIFIVNIFALTVGGLPLIFTRPYFK